MREGRFVGRGSRRWCSCLRSGSRGRRRVRWHAGVEPKVVGGRPADPGEFPFMAAVLNESITGDDYQKQLSPAR